LCVPVGFGFGFNKASEKGYFGPWKVCQELLYGREKCGTAISTFQPIGKLFFFAIITPLVKQNVPEYIPRCPELEQKFLRDFKFLNISEEK